nr:hypothetical protein [Tanacetum cinerariifolium]
MVCVHLATDVASYLVAYTRERKGGYSRPSATESISKGIPIQKRSKKPISPLSKGSGTPGGGRTTPNKEARSSHSFHQKDGSARIVLDERITEYAHKVRAIGCDSKLPLGKTAGQTSDLATHALILTRLDLLRNELDLLRTGLTNRDLDLLLLSEHSGRRDLEVSLLFDTLLWCFNEDLDLLWFLLISKDPLEELLLALFDGYLPWELLNLYLRISMENFSRSSFYPTLLINFLDHTGGPLDIRVSLLALRRLAALYLRGETGCSLPSEETGCSLPLKETCWPLPPEETGCSLPPEKTGCSLPLGETLLLSYFLWT